MVLLLCLYEQRSVLRAAKSAGMTQPAASKMLGELEERLGVKLFERYARGVEATWYGEILVRHARAALVEIERAHEEILALRSGLTGRASIGAVMNPGTHLIPKVIAAIKKSHPRLVVSVEMDSSRPLVNKLLEGRLDFVVGRILDPEGADELSFEPLSDEPHVVVARAGHPFAGKRDLKLADLAQLGWVLQGSSGVQRSRFNSVMREHGLEQPSNIVETSALPLTIALLQITDMVSVQPEQALRPYCRAGMLTILPLSLGITMDFFGIITRREHLLSAGAEIVLRALRETAASLYATRRELPVALTSV
jgi:DNA-binding transcriptional LysR family regulator